MSNTAVIEGRIDIRDLATCADYFMQQDIKLFNKSSLLRRIVITFAHAAETQGARHFESTEEALGFLFDAGLGPVNRIVDSRGKRSGSFTLANTIRLESSRESIADIAAEAMRIMDKMDDSTYKGLGVDSEVDPTIRAQRVAEEDATQKARMDEFVRSLKVAKGHDHEGQDQGLGDEQNT